MFFGEGFRCCGMWMGNAYMKKRVLVVFFFGLGLIAGSQEISIRPDHHTAVYRAGEPVCWSISVQKDGEAVMSGQADFSVKSGGLFIIENGTLNITNGLATVEIAREDPGALLLEVSFDNSTNYGGVVFSPERILPSAEEPDDFVTFWQEKIAELHSVPANVVLEPADSGDEDVEYWKITMDNIRGTRIHGQLAKPKTSSGPLPAMVQFQYAGVYPLKKEWVTGPAKEGWLALNIIAHDLPIDREEPFYKDLKAGPLNVYPAIGCEDRETSYFLRMYLSCYRAVDYLTERSDWNGKTLLVTGISQGGMQSVMVAGLHPAVTALVAEVPAGCDLTGSLVGRASGWPAWSWSGNEKAVEVSKYYDVVNFARHIRCPALIGAGAIDRVCPPEGVVAMFNQIQNPKKLVICPVGGHNGSDGGHEPFQKVALEWKTALRAGAPLPVQ